MKRRAWMSSLATLGCQSVLEHLSKKCLEGKECLRMFVSFCCHVFSHAVKWTDSCSSRWRRIRPQTHDTSGKPVGFNTQWLCSERVNRVKPEFQRENRLTTFPSNFPFFLSFIPPSDLWATLYLGPNADKREALSLLICIELETKCSLERSYCCPDIEIINREFLLIWFCPDWLKKER